MSRAVGNPAQRWRWAVTGRRRTWHALLPLANGTYVYALCGYEPVSPASWGPLLASPPRLSRYRWCTTCRALCIRQGGPPY